MKNGGYTDEQIQAMSEKVRRLPDEERITFDGLLKSMTLLRQNGDFTTPGVLERHYGLAPLIEQCPGLDGTCRRGNRHKGDCGGLL